MKRKWLLLALVAAPVVLVACLMAFVKVSGSLVPFEYLRGAQKVSDDRVEGPGVGGPMVMRMRTFNIHRKASDVSKIADRELKAAGWTQPMAIGGATFRMYTKTAASTTSSPAPAGLMAAPMGGLGSSMETCMVIAGRVEPGKQSTGVGFNENTKVEGWTAVVLTQMYSPNWAEKAFDRLTLAKPISQEQWPWHIEYGREFFADLERLTPSGTVGISRKP
jgi:hypothetical protein